jgi:hypothetical protein
MILRSISNDDLRCVFHDPSAAEPPSAKYLLNWVGIFNGSAREWQTVSNRVIIFITTRHLLLSLTQKKIEAGKKLSGTLNENTCTLEERCKKAGFR